MTKKINTSIPAGNYTAKTIVVVGGNSGLGFEAVIEVAKQGANVILISRSLERGLAAVEKAKKLSQNTNISAIACDISSLSSVRLAAQNIISHHRSIDAILCNAAIPDWRKESLGKTEEGLNKIFTTNYLGHFLVVRLLLNTLLSSDDPRVIFICGPQQFYRNAPNLSDLEYSNSGFEKHAYSGAKIALFCLAAELPRRFPVIATAVIDPGLVATEFQKDSPFILQLFLKLGLFKNEPHEVGELYAWLALSPSIREEQKRNGSYTRFFNPKFERCFKNNLDNLKFGRETLGIDYQSKLWVASEKCLGI